MLTHIHLDHAGATGSLLELNPEIEVFVHERGARHLVDPSKLMASATRIYREDMGRLWGNVLPVPAGRVRELRGGERLLAGGRELEVAATPGHASHHVCYFDRSSGVAFVGDTAGIRRGAGTYVMPPTPPPDIDLEAWRQSGDRIMAWDPDTLFLTALWALPRCQDSLPGALRAPRFVERGRSAAPCGLVYRRPGTRATVCGGGPTGDPAHSRRDRSRTVFEGRQARLLVAGTRQVLAVAAGVRPYTLCSLSVLRRFVFGQNPRRTAVRILVLSAICFITFRWVLIPIRTEGSSMLPTYVPDKLHFVNRLAYGPSGPERGDVVAIMMAGPHVLYVKRIVGLPGERVSIAGGQVQINGSGLAEPYVRHRRAWDKEEVTLGPREYFVIGDNRGMSAADHDFGRVQADKILGKLIF